MLVIPIDTEIYPDFNMFCEWCTVAPATLKAVYDEPIQLSLFNKVVFCQYLCEHCVNEAQVAEEYALNS